MERLVSILLIWCSILLIIQSVINIKLRYENFKMRIQLEAYMDAEELQEYLNEEV